MVQKQNVVRKKFDLWGTKFGATFFSCKINIMSLWGGMKKIFTLKNSTSEKKSLRKSKADHGLAYAHWNDHYLT